MKSKTILCHIITLFVMLVPVALQGKGVCDSLLHEAIDAAVEQRYFHSMELLTQAGEMAEEARDYEALFWILNNIGINHAEMTDYNSALENFSAAYKIASEKLGGRCERSVSNNIAGVYMLDKKFDKALAQYQELYEVNKNSNDSLFIGGCAMNIANASLSLNRLQQSLQYIQVADKMFEHYPKEKLELQVLHANLLRKQKQYAEAYGIVQDIIHRAQTDSLRSIETAAILQMTQILYDMGDYAGTIDCAGKALMRNISIEERKNLYSVLSQAYYSTHCYDEGFAYKDSVLHMADSIWNTHKEYLFENSKIKIELLKRESEIREYQLHSRNAGIMLILGVVAAIILVWALINQVVKNRQQKQISELHLNQERQRQQLLQAQLEEERAKALLEEKRFQGEIEQRDKELMSKAMIVANRNDIIANIIKMLTKTKTVADMHDEELKRAIAGLQHSIDEHEAWKDFTIYFEQRNDAFIAALKEKYPGLNNNEIRFLSLVYINLNTKEIASLLNITPEYCKKKRQQLARKMGFENSKALFSYLSTLAP